MNTPGGAEYKAVNRAIIALLCSLFSISLHAQDTIFLNGDTIRVGGLEWDIEKDYSGKKPLLTRNPDIYGDSVYIFHGFYKKTHSIEQIVFGYQDNFWFTPHGPGRYYYLTGELLGKRNFVQGKLEGPAVDYHKNGMIRMIATFKADAPDGEYQTFFDNGITESSCRYTEGKIEGLVRTWYNNGALQSSAVYEGGWKNGPDTTFYDNGEVWNIVNYRNGAEDGGAVFYHRNGKAASEWVYESGRLMRIVYARSQEGHPLDSGTLEDGEGAVNEYDENGLLKAVCRYKKGILISRRPVK